VVHAVGDVVVDVQVRAPGVEQMHQPARLGCVELQVIAVEVVTVGRRAEAHALLRAVLIRTVEDRDALVTVDVVDRYEDECHTSRQLRQTAKRDVAQDHQRRVLAVDLSGVDTALDPDDRPPRGRRRGGFERALGRDDDIR
jgi:hypothetical protein